MSMNKTVYSQFDECVYSFDHESGLYTSIVPKPGFAKKFAVFSVDFGSINTRFKTPLENDITSVPCGVAHFLEHKLFEQEDGNVLDRYVALGASPNAATSFSRTYYYFTCTDRFDECLKLLLHYVLNPYLTDENVEKEKGIIAQEIGMYLDDPYYMCMFNLLRGVYSNNPVRNDIAGSVEDIMSLDKETLTKCHKAFYHPSNMSLSVVGDVNPEEVRAIVDAAGLPPVREYGVTRLIDDEPNELHCKMSRSTMDVAMPLFNIGFKDRAQDFQGVARVKRDITGTILKDMLFGKISKFYETLYASGLINQEFSADYEIERDYALATLSGSSPDPSKLCDYLQGYLRDTAAVGLSREDFEVVRNAAAGRMIKRFNSPEVLGRMIGALRLQGVDAFDYFTACDTITYDDVDEMFREIYLGDMAVSLVESERR